MKEIARKRSERPVVLPVRRVLMAVCVCYLTGIFCADVIALPLPFIFFLSTLFLAWAVLRLRVKKRALFCMLAFMFAFGYLRAGAILTAADMPSLSGASFSGTVVEVIKPYRVRLRDVSGDVQPKRDVVVTLMLDEEADAWPTAPRVGQRVIGTGRLFVQDTVSNPGGVDRRIHALCDGYELSGYLLKGWRVEGDTVFSWREVLRQLRERVLSRTVMIFGEEAALFQGIMLGERAMLDSETTAAMRLTGTAHILTVSGLHLSMIAAAVSRLLSRVPIGRRAHFMVLSLFLVFFTVLTGAAAGTIRACIMAMIREYAKMRGRQYEPLTALSAAALGMTLVQPIWALNASFQFSFFVVLGIQLFSHSFTDAVQRHVRVRGLLRALLTMAAVSASAQIASVPMQMMLYGYVPVLSLPMNMLSAALMSYLLLGGWGLTALSAASLPICAHLAKPLCMAAAFFEEISVRVAAFDAAIVRLPAPYGVWVLLFAGVMLLSSSRIRYGRWRMRAIAVMLSLLLLGYAPRFDPQARYVQLDVGQGDAALFREGRRAALIDVGPADSYDVLRYLRHEGLFVDAVILSHLDEDHAGALGTLLASEVDISDVFFAKGAANEELSPDVQEALQKMAQTPVLLHEVERGEKIEAGRVTLDVLAPDESVSGSNERSLLLHAKMEDVDFLLTGDLTASSEPAHVPDIDVLKVAHHGSRNATSDAFLAKAKPEVAIISVGENNRYGHPHTRVLDSLESIGAKTLRTNECGCITLRLEDGQFAIETFCGTL